VNTRIAMVVGSRAGGVFAVLLVLAGCSSDDGGDTGADTQDASESGSSSQGDGASSSESGDTEPDTGSSESDTEAMPSEDDLFACGLSSECEQIVMHLDPEPETALECAARIVTADMPGLIFALDTPGPDIDETEYFVFSLGDGTAIVQTRERHCEFDCPFDAPGPQRLCQLDVPMELVDACSCVGDMCGGCSWDPFFGLGECSEIAEPYDCTGIASFFEG